MKARLRPVLGCALCVLSGTCVAQIFDYGAPMPRTTETNRADAGHSQKFSRSKDLVGASVKDAQGNKLGSIDEILMNTRQGETFASIEVSGGRYALVPIQALSITRPAGMIRDAEVALNTTKVALQSGPTVAKNEWQNLDNPSFTQRIYSHYSLQPPTAAMGGSAGQSLGGAATGAGSSQTTNSAPQQSVPMPK